MSPEVLPSEASLGGAGELGAGRRADWRTLGVWRQDPALLSEGAGQPPVSVRVWWGGGARQGCVVLYLPRMH